MKRIGCAIDPLFQYSARLSMTTSCREKVHE